MVMVHGEKFIYDPITETCNPTKISYSKSIYKVVKKDNKIYLEFKIW